MRDQLLEEHKNLILIRMEELDKRITRIETTVFTEEDATAILTYISFRLNQAEIPFSICEWSACSFENGSTTIKVEFSS